MPIEKKILYVWKSPYPWDIRVDKICSYLAENNYEVNLLAKWRRGEKETEKINGFNVIRAGFNKDPKLFYPIPQNPNWKKAIQEAITETSPDVIIVREIMLVETTFKALAGKKIPIIIDMAENYPAAMKEWTKYNDTAFKRFVVHTLKYPEKVERKAVSLADAIVVVCEEQIQRLKDSFDYDPSKVFVVHNTPVKIPTENQYSHNPKIIFGHHGHLTNEKSIKNFLIAFLNAAKDKDWEFHVYGGGESLPELRSLSNDHASKAKVKFFGKYDFNDLDSILNTFTIGVIPYQINDFNQYTIHNKIFDYFAKGIPVLVSENKPQRRVVESTGSGYILNCENINELENALNELDLDHLENYSTNSFNAAVEEYNWENDAKELMRSLSNV